MPFIGKQTDSANSKIKKYSFTVSASTQQNFSISMSGSDEVQVFLNGVLLQENVDFTATSSQVALTTNAVQNDIVDVHIYQSFVLADAVTEATAKATSISSAIALGG
ncbi:hypothetical protein [uncultured Mediterranean phage uvMED]|nr:hypothetical protein [uncultured Mediterranean phage uvMED]